MRITLKVGATLFPLAGAAGVSERTHSSAAEFTLTPESAVQIDEFVRGEYARVTDRGNLLNVVSFTTTRQFSSPAAAQIWCLDYDETFPRSGTVVFDAILPSGAILRRHMGGAVVSPPRRRCNGATALVDFLIKGGEVVPAGGGTLASAIINPTGADNSIAYTAAAAGAAGNSITIAYTLPTQATITVGVVGSAISVGAGAKARMIVTGAVTAGVNGTYVYDVTSSPTDPKWTPGGVPFASLYGVVEFSCVEVFGGGDYATVVRYAATAPAGDLYYAISSTAPVDLFFPDGLTYEAPYVGTGTPTVAASPPTAAQVLAAINASTAASALVNVAASGAVTGAVAAVSATNLTGGTD
jgi:hypothetical protein